MISDSGSIKRDAIPKAGIGILKGGGGEEGGGNCPRSYHLYPPVPPPI
jgi:hypothetical protein